MIRELLIKLNYAFIIAQDKMANLYWIRYNPLNTKHITNFLCKHGRHDYELADVISEEEALLSCFYCQRQKRSSVYRGK